MMNSINCYQLTAESILSNDNYIQLAQLIYRTDVYIYPCIFENEDDAVTVIVNLLKSNLDTMFSKSNCFVAVTPDENIVGLILWKKGPLIWDAIHLKKQAKKNGIELSPHFGLVKQAYFSSYEENAPDQISLINVSVDQTIQGCGVGTTMMVRFVQAHKTEKMELFVLADNDPAIHLYREHAQFKEFDKIQGFSHDQRDLPCLVMRR